MPGAGLAQPDRRHQTAGTADKPGVAAAARGAGLAPRDKALERRRGAGATRDSVTQQVANDIGAGRIDDATRVRALKIYKRHT